MEPLNYTNLFCGVIVVFVLVLAHIYVENHLTFCVSMCVSV
jgi:hypothetical protein